MPTVVTHLNNIVARIRDSAFHDEVEPHDSVTAPSSSQSMLLMPSASSNASTSQDDQQDVELDDDAAADHRTHWYWILQRVMEVVVTTGAIVKLSNHHHQQTNTQFYYRPDTLPVVQPIVSKHWREKYHIPWTSLPQTHLGVFQLCPWPLKMNNIKFIY